MAVVRTTRTGFLGNLFNSILAVPIGILIFLASFAVLFWNEGRPNLGKIAERESVVAAADDTSAHQGELVAVTGTLELDEQIGDPQYLANGDYVTLDRVVEQYVWVQHSESETRDKVGGGTETVTTYTYEMEWTSSPQDSSNFEDPSYSNPPQRVFSDSWSATNVSIGAWQLVVAEFQAGGSCIGCRGLPGGSTLDLSDESVKLQGEGVRATRQGNYLYLDGSPATPNIGDHRISFRALQPGGTVTAFGQAEGAGLVGYNFEGDKTFLRMLWGSRDEAISSLRTEHTVITWVLRLVGFFMMWMGMGMVFAPLHAIAGILPFAKKGTKFVVGLVTFPIALVLTVVTIVVSMILHSIVALIIVFILVGGLAFWLWKNRDKNAAQGNVPGGMAAAPAGGVPPGPAPGAPPSAPPGGAPPGPPPA